MPLPPAERPRAPHPAKRLTITWVAPREAAARALVYRRRRAERPRERGLRIAAALGALLVHLWVLFGVILGPAYDYRPPVHESVALQVRLLDKPEPPPPPPVHGAPPRRVGPRQHRPATVRRPVTSTRAKVTAAPAGLPVIVPPVQPATIRIAAPAAPVAPPSLPRPRPLAARQPEAGAPPRVRIAAPVVAPPVPPRFQPEPARKAQAEGTRPMPPAPSLVLPSVPRPSAPAPERPTLAIEQPRPQPDDTQPSSLVPAAAARAAAPVEPALEPVPLLAPAAPAVRLEAPSRAPAPEVPRERPQVQAPAIELAAPAPLPVAPALPEVATPATDVPSVEAPSLERPSLTVSRPAVEVQAPSVPTEGAPEETAPPTAETAPPSPPARAPDATPEDIDRGEPGAAASPAPPEATATATGRRAPRHGRGKGQGQQGRPRPGADEGPRLGGYIAVKPHGDTRIMEHRSPDIGYRPTRFEQDWTPEGESSIDTALRHAVEKTTVHHTFHLPRGVRIDCHVSPLFPVGLLGCNDADGPAPPSAKDGDVRLNLPPARPLVPPAPAGTSPAASHSAPSPAATVPLPPDPAAQCAAARVAGGPLPPACAAPAGAGSSARPASGTSSWVPASDQFH